MKCIKYILSMLGVATLLFACTDDYDRNPGGDITSRSPVLNSLAQNEFFIEKPTVDSEDNFLFRLSWTAPRFSFSNGLPTKVSNLKYTVQAGILGDLFEKATVVQETDDLFTDISAKQFYALAQKLAGENIEGDVNIEFRILVTYEGVTDALVSNAQTTVLLYELGETEEPEPLKELTIRFKQTTGVWDAFAVYAYGHAEVYGGWPGLKLEEDADGWYSFVVPINRPINLVINNNGGDSQFDFLTDPTSGGCYEFDTDVSAFTAIDCPEEPITIRWKYVGTEWTSSAIYAWGGEPAGDTFGGWPGKAGVPDENGWNSVTVPAGQTAGNVIFSNGVGGEGGQFDLGVAVTENVCFEITSNSATAIDCP